MLEDKWAIIVIFPIQLLCFKKLFKLVNIYEIFNIIAENMCEIE